MERAHPENSYNFCGTETQLWINLIYIFKPNSSLTKHFSNRNRNIKFYCFVMWINVWLCVFIYAFDFQKKKKNASQTNSDQKLFFFINTKNSNSMTKTQSKNYNCYFCLDRFDHVSCEATTSRFTAKTAKKETTRCFEWSQQYVKRTRGTDAGWGYAYWWWWPTNQTQ